MILIDPYVRNFFRAQLGLEQAYYVDGSLRPTLLSFSDSYMDVIRAGFMQMVADDSFGPAEYERLTDIEFPDRESLEAYLRAMYAHLFEDAPQQPMPPG
ncbi:hypothetical protein ACFQ7B_27975 [Streptomyces erythrochromogenes]|uniref:hypothetical protein n=1 Tax=Streptomyces erythrochromogenes TaxID=285574 RepID=UPI0036A0C358